MKLELVINEDVVQGTVNEVELIESKAQRDELAGRIEVLEKVKELLLLPEMEFATTRQIADYYEVPVKTIQTIYARHTREIHEDGYRTVTGRELVENLATLTMNTAKIEQKRGQIIVETEGQRIQLSYTKIGLYPKRAILRVGMLLRDSEVARTVRTQLLNIEENTRASAKVVAINSELAELRAKAEQYDRLTAGMSVGHVETMGQLLDTLNQKLVEAEGKAEKLETHIETQRTYINEESLLCFTDFGTFYLNGATAHQVRTWLQEVNVLKLAKRNNRWQPYKDYAPCFGLGQTNKNGYIKYDTRIKPKGIDILLRKLDSHPIATQFID
ncbi:TPA: phage antirepressor KilAC domain-containing protein [Bacillus mycoides]|nr:phage antirepressor KilAC domain-containing protein [Bacillus mycoides]